MAVRIARRKACIGEAGAPMKPMLQVTWRQELQLASFVLSILRLPDITSNVPSACPQIQS